MNSSDEEIFLENIPKDGTAIGNTTLQKKLNWTKDRYWRIRDTLIDDGKIERGRGKGGSVHRLIVDSQIAESQLATNSVESELYEPLLKVLREEWVREMGIEPNHIHFKITAKQGRKLTGGTWTRPDITAVSVRSFQYIPGKYVDVWTFEVKTSDALDITAVFEAAAHASSATRSYALIEIPKEQSSVSDGILARCEKEAERLNVGLITFSKASDFKTWETKVDAPRLDTAPEALNDLIGRLSDESKRVISLWK